MKTVKVHVYKNDWYSVYDIDNPSMPYTTTTEIEMSKKLLKRFNKMIEEFDKIQQEIHELVEGKQNA